MEAVLNILKERLPDPIAGQIEPLLSGDGGGTDMMENLIGKGITGLFGSN